MTLDETIGGTKSNSYVDVAFADSYFAGHFSTDKAARWAALTTPQKVTALIQATRVLETIRCAEETASDLDYVPYYNRAIGAITFVYEDYTRATKSGYYQKLQFPRNKDVDQTTSLFFIPEEVKFAQCEQAIFLLDFDEDTMVSFLAGAASDVITVGQVSLRKEINKRGSFVAPIALEFLKPFILKGSSKLRRG